MATLGEIALTKLSWTQQNRIRRARMDTHTLVERVRHNCGHTACYPERETDAHLCDVRELARRVLEGTR